MSCKTCSNRRVALAAAIVAAIAALPPGEEGEHEDGTPHVATNYPDISEMLSLAIVGLHPAVANEDAEARFMEIMNNISNAQAVWANNTFGWVSDWFAGVATAFRIALMDRVEAGNDEGLTADAIERIREQIVQRDRQADMIEALSSGDGVLVVAGNGVPGVDPRYVH